MAKWTLPEYIGHPGYQYSPDGVPSMTFENTLDDTLQIAEIEPLVPKMEKNINLYSGVGAWTEYTEYLESNDISPGKNNGKLKVVINQITPLSESYSNEFGPSELASSLQSIASGGLQELAFMNNFQGGKSIEKMADKGGLVGKMAALYKAGTDTAGELIGDLTNSNLGQDVTQILQNPTQKIDIPSMWKGNSFTGSYQITVRLYCFDPSNDDHFGTQILAPLGALMMFAVPRSDRGKFYTWPFMMNFKIPGQCCIPLGYCQSFDVVKGGDVCDISWIKRPGTVDVRMNVNTVFGVRTNSKNKNSMGSRPTILQELNTMYEMQESKEKAFSNAISSAAANAQDQSFSDTGRTTETSEQAEAATDAIFNSL